MTRLNGEARYLRSNGMGLGLDRGPLFRRTLEQEEIKLQPGDVFMFYTDGIVESRSEAGEEYGYDRLLDVIAANRHEDADDMHTLLLDDLNQFIGPNKDYDDDLTLVVLKWHGIDLARSASHDGLHQEPVSSPYEADESAS
jgi:serine phosphatase RsbU (regulator of sigma subunit)